MVLRGRGGQSNPLRYLAYVSDSKLDMLLGQIDGPAMRSIAAELKLDIKLVALTLASSPADKSLRERSREAKLEVAERYLRRRDQIGDLTSTSGWVAVDAEMDWNALDDETVLFCGRAADVLVVLGGSVSNLLGRMPSRDQTGSHPPAIRAAIAAAIGGQGADGRPNLGRDLLAATKTICITPQPVHFLAWIISHGALAGRSPYRAYLMATPLYVEPIATISTLTGRSHGSGNG